MCKSRFLLNLNTKYFVYDGCVNVMLIITRRITLNKMRSKFNTGPVYSNWEWISPKRESQRKNTEWLNRFQTTFDKHKNTVAQRIFQYLFPYFTVFYLRLSLSFSVIFLFMLLHVIVVVSLVHSLPLYLSLFLFFILSLVFGLVCKTDHSFTP